MEAEADDLVSPLSTELFTSPRNSGSSPRRPSRAFQARVQKAKHLQMAFNNSNHRRNSSNSGTSSTTSRRSSWSSAGSSSLDPQQAQHRGGSSSHSLASSSARSVASSIASTEDDAGAASTANSIREATAWAELELDGPVLCTAMSRTVHPSSSASAPPLYVAVGTVSGSVVVQELLVQENDGVLPHLPDSRTEAGRNANVSMDAASHAKLGPPVSVQLDGSVRSLDFSPDGQYLAVGGDDCQCRIYRLDCENSNGDEDEDQRSKLSKLVQGAELERVDRVTAVQFSPNNKYLAVGGFDGAVAILATHTNFSSKMPLEPVTEIQRDGLVMTVDWSPNSRYLAIGGSDKCCAIVDCEASWNIFRAIRRKCTIQAVRWHPTGQYLAIGAADTVAIVIGRDAFATTNEIQLPKSSNGSSGRSRTSVMCWSPNGSYFVVCGTARTCTLYETKSYTVVHEIARPENISSVVWGQHSSLSTTTAADAMPQRFLAIGGEDGKVSVVKAGMEVGMNAGASVAGDDMSTSCMSSSASYFSSRGDWVLKENAFQDLEDAVETSIDASGINITIGEGDATVLTVAFSKGSKSRPSAFFAHSTDNGLVTVRNTTDWKVIAEIQFPKPVPTMTFSTGSRYLALGCIDSNVYVSDTTANWELVAKIEFAAPITALRFASKNNDRLAVGSVDGTMAFLDPAKGFDFAGEVETSNAPVVAVDWSTKNLAVGREDGTVAVYETNQVVQDVYNSVADVERKAAVTAISFGVSSRFLAVGGLDGLVGIYSSKGGWVLCHQVNMDRSISSVLWCPLGRHLAYGSESGQIKVIDTIFWAEVNEAETGPSEERVAIQSNLAFSQDGKLLAFSRSDLGFGVMDSTKKWSFALNMLDDGQSTSGGSVSDPDIAPSSISSREELDDSRFEDDGDGRYEV